LFGFVQFCGQCRRKSFGGGGGFFLCVCVWETSAEDQADFTGREKEKEKEKEREHTGLGVDTRVYALTSIFPV